MSMSNPSAPPAYVPIPAPNVDPTSLQLPADPPTNQQTSLAALLAGTGFTPGSVSLPTAVPTVIDSPTVPVQLAPSVSLDATGTPHVTIPLTKKTKAIIGTIAAAVTFIGLDVTAYIPDQYKVYALGVITIAGGVATWMGIAVPVNMPVNYKKK